MSNNTEKKLSHQKANELRIIVFKRVYGWLGDLSWDGELGLPIDEKKYMPLEIFSPEQVRRFIWDSFEEKFRVKDQCLDLPDDQYEAAREYLNNLTLMELWQDLAKRGVDIPKTEEKRPSAKERLRRYVQNVNAHRAKSGKGPILPKASTWACFSSHQ